jgi:hypothetical protein
MGFWTRRITNVAALMGGTAASTLLGGETDGLAIDFTDASLTVRDTTTTSNTWGQIEGNAQDFWRSRSFTSYSSPSPKITRDSSGNYTYRPHNLVAMSQEFRSAYFTATRSSITTSAVTAPDVTSTMFKMVEDSSNNSHQFERNNVTIVSGLIYTVSIYAKAAERSWILFGDNTIASVGAWFNLGTGVVGTQQASNMTATIEDMGSGVYRCKIQWLSTGTGSRPVVYTSTGDSNFSYQGDGASGVYLWGFQLNAGPTALTYVPTRAHNLCLQSADLATTWTNSGTTETTNSTAAPDGTTTADTITEDTNSTRHAVLQQHSGLTIGATYCASVYLKQGTQRYAALQWGSAAANQSLAVADLQLGTVTTTNHGGSATGTSAGITGVGNGWYRLWVTNTAAATNPFFLICMSDSGTPSYDVSGSPTYLGASLTIFAWGMGLELVASSSSTPGKYVATTTAAVYSANYDLPREWGAPNTVTNLLLQSQDLSTSWTNASTTESTNATTAPGGTTTADKLIPDNLALLNTTAHIFQALTVAASTLTYTASVYVKAAGHNRVGMRMQDAAGSGQSCFASWSLTDGSVVSAASANGSWAGASGTATAVGDDWYRFTLTATNRADTTLRLYLYPQDSVLTQGDGTAGIYVWGAQVEQASTVGTYLHTTSTARTDYFYPTNLACQGLLVEEARTNICLYARDLTQSNYVKTSATAALTATGVDGVANTASTLTASAANGTAVQNIVSASAARSLSMFVKRRTGTGTATVSHGATTGSELVTNGTFTTDLTGWTTNAGTPAVVAAVCSDNGAGSYRITQTLTLTAGKLYRIAGTFASGGTGIIRLGTDSSGATGSAYAVSGLANGTYSVVAQADATTMYLSFGAATSGTWDNVSLLEVAETDITSSINSSTWTRVSITNETITNPCVAIKLATSGDAIDVDYCQSEAGAFITSPIYTGSASVVRAIDNIRCATSVMAYSQSAVTLYGKGTPQATDAFATNQIPVGVDDGTINERLCVSRASGSPLFFNTDGGVAQCLIDAGTWSQATSGKIAGSAAANDFAGSFNGGAAGTDTSGTMPSVHTFGVGNTASTSAFNGHIAQIMVLPRAMSDAELVVVTT